MLSFNSLFIYHATKRTKPLVYICLICVLSIHSLKSFILVWSSLTLLKLTKNVVTTILYSSLFIYHVTKRAKPLVYICLICVIHLLKCFILVWSSLTLPKLTKNAITSILYSSLFIYHVTKRTKPLVCICLICVC